MLRKTFLLPAWWIIAFLPDSSIGFIDCTSNHLACRHSARFALRWTQRGSHSMPATHCEVQDDVVTLERRAKESPQESSVWFQLAMARAQRLANSREENRPFMDLEHIISALQQAVRLESNLAFRNNARSIRNVVVALRKLGLYYLKQGRVEECLSTIDEQQYWISRKMPFDVEDKSRGTNMSTPEFEWVFGGSTNHKRFVALRTKGDLPLLNKTSINRIRTALRNYRQTKGDESSSTRFTMQYSGNSDYHLADLCEDDEELRRLINDVLKSKIYPLVRASFHQDGLGGIPNAPLCVYDALIVRYDPEKALSSGRPQASLPLVRFSNPLCLSLAAEIEG